MEDWDPFADPAGFAEQAAIPNRAVASPVVQEDAAESEEEAFFERMRRAQAISEQADRERLARAAKKKAEEEERMTRAHAKEQAVADIRMRQPMQSAVLPGDGGRRAPPTPMLPSKETLSYSFGGPQTAKPSQPAQSSQPSQPKQMLPSYESLLDSVEDEEPDQHLVAGERGSSTATATSATEMPSSREEMLRKRREQARFLTEQSILTTNPDVATLDVTGMHASEEDERRRRMMENHPDLFANAEPVIAFNADKVVAAAAAAAAAAAEAKEAAEKRKAGSTRTQARGSFSAAVAAHTSRSTASSEAPSVEDLLAKLDAEAAADAQLVLGRGRGRGRAAQHRGRSAVGSGYAGAEEFTLIGPPQPRHGTGSQSRMGASSKADDLDRRLDEAARRGDRAEVTRLLSQRMASQAQQRSEEQPVAAPAAPKAMPTAALGKTSHRSAPAQNPLQSNAKLPSVDEASSSQDLDDVPNLEEMLASIDLEEEAAVEAESTRESFLALGDIGGYEEDFKPVGTSSSLASIIKMTGAGDPRELLDPKFVERRPRAEPAERGTSSVEAEPTPYFMNRSMPGSTQASEEKHVQPETKFRSRKLVLHPAPAPPKGPHASKRDELRSAFSMTPEVLEALDAGLLNMKLPKRHS